MSRAAILLSLLFLGCAEPDANRIVNPVTWHELSASELADRCLDYSGKIRGCVVSGPEGDHIYTLPVARP
jgi:hypothetical protein